MTIGGLGTCQLDYAWRMPELSMRAAVHEPGLHLLAAIGVGSHELHVWDVDPGGGNPVDDLVATLTLPAAGGSGDHLTQETTAVSVPGSMWSPTSFLTTKLKDNHRGLPWDLWEKKEGSDGDFWEGPAVGQTGRHSCFLYTARAVSIINKHDPATPLFLYFSQQVPHMPLTELPEFEDPKNTLKMSRTYNAMVACADQATLNLTLSLKLQIGRAHV